MNALILFPEELAEGGIAILQDQRLARYREHFPTTVGQTIRVAVVGQYRCDATIESLDHKELRLSLGPTLACADRLPITLLVAVPRPQTVKKVISLAVQCGIEQLYFLRSHHTIPSYLHSHSLRPEHINQEVVKALEQVWDAMPPQIHVIERMGDFFERELPRIVSGENKGLFLGEPQSHLTAPLGEIYRQHSPRQVVLGIGPEKGWSPAEQRGFSAAGFSLIHLSNREYRVETALALFLGQLQLLLADI